MRGASAGLLEQTPIDFVAANHLRGHHKVPDFALHRQVVHQLQHEVFEDHAQAASANFALKSQLRYGLEGVVGKAQPNILKLEEALVLFQQGIFGLGQNFHQCRFVQVAHNAGNRQASHKLGDQAVADQVTGLHLFEQFGVAPLSRKRGWQADVRVKYQRTAADTALDNFFQADKCAAAYE